MPETVLVKLAGLEFPRRCPACGGAGEVRLARAKVFHDRDGDGDGSPSVETYTPWFCGDCAALHQRELWRPGPADYFKRFFASGEVLGALVAGVVGLFFFKEAVVKLSLILFFFSLWPLGVAWFLISRNWKRQAYRFAAPPTSITSSVDFSDDQSAEFEPAWASFEFRDAAYAAAFRELNRERVWSPASAEAVAARQKRAWANRKRQWLYGAILGVFILLAIAAWWMDWGD